MTWEDVLHSRAVAAGILGAILGLVVWLNNRDVNRHIRAMRAESDAQIQAIRAGTAATLARIDQRAEERHREARERGRGGDPGRD